MTDLKNGRGDELGLIAPRALPLLCLAGQDYPHIDETVSSVLFNIFTKTREQAMTENPYATLGATIADESATKNEQPIRIYSPTQVACGTIGGPVGLIYFIKANFAALGNKDAERKTLIYGAFFILSLVILLPLLPEKFPSSPFTIAYILIAREVAKKYQMTKQAISESPSHDFQSNWRVLGFGLLCLVGSAIVLMVPLMLLIALGVWKP